MKCVANGEILALQLFYVFSIQSQYYVRTHSIIVNLKGVQVCCHEDSEVSFGFM